MSRPPPPNAALATLAATLGEDDTRELVRTYLREFPATLRALGGGDRAEAHRAAHSQKSTARLMGLPALAETFAALERDLARPGPPLSPARLAALAADFTLAVAPLRRFAEM